MKRAHVTLLLLGTFSLCCGSTLAQTQAPVDSGAASVQNQQQTPDQQSQQQSSPLYRITVMAQTTKAINYRHLNGATKIDFRGTVLLPLAHGEANVEVKRGAIRIQAKFDKLQPATRFGSEYLTYVLWAVSPEGRADNLGEILLDGSKSKLDVTSQLQAFALIVTAEPYFAVTQPSQVVVLENAVRPDTVGDIEQVDAKFELLQRGQYSYVETNAQPSQLDPHIPLGLYEARNAVNIARALGADHYAADSYQKAVQLLTQAEEYQAHKSERKQVEMAAREAVQTAEDARAITAKRVEDERQAKEREAAAQREAQAKAEAQAAETAKLQAELDAERAAREKTEADAARAAALVQQQAAEAEAARERLAADQAAREKADADAARAAALAQQQQAEQQAQAAKAQQQQAEQQAQAAQAQADAAKAAALAQQQAAEATVAQARQAAAEAEKEKAALRAQLLQQLNTILQTRDSARGLIVNMSDVLFDTASYTLKPGAREKLAKISGIVLAHPGLNLKIEGYTDSVGSDEYNQQLSENRASAVREFLIEQGVAGSGVTAQGFGKTQPVASNDTPEGRQRNRRVELIVSGEAIDATASGPATPSPSTQP
ncbi:MAG TPA: OmpA family protein [Candidatus Acidoferrales bacterium]|nr:OmpA family protein [Candidatus Acidoferrales bacterium]